MRIAPRDTYFPSENMSLGVTQFVLFVFQGEDVYKGLLVTGINQAELDFTLRLMEFRELYVFSCAYIVE